MHAYHFGPFRVEPIERRLLRGATVVQLAPKTFDLLLVFVENPGRLLEKDALMKRLWPDAFVEEANLANNVSLLRKALVDGTETAEYIETVPRRGYRFLADVVSVDDANGNGHPAEQHSPGVFSQIAPVVPAPARASPREWLTQGITRRSVVLAALTGVVAGVVAFVWGRWSAPASRVFERFFVQPPPGTSLPAPEQSLAPMLSPDGTRLAFRVFRQGNAILAVRSRGALHSYVLEGTEGAHFPFWSPDSRILAFFADKELKRIDADGGPVQKICDAAPGVGGTWNADGVIVFARSTAEGLFRVAATRGRPVPVTSLQNNEVSHQHPQFLPDGRRFLYFAAPDGVYVGSLDGDPPVQILTTPQKAMYSPPGYLLFVEDRTLFAQSFDVDHLRPFGEPIAVGEHVRTGGRAVDGRAVGGASFSVSQNGVLAYGSDGPIEATLTWRDRNGHVVDPVPPFTLGRFGYAELSPDGRRLVFEVGATRSEYEIWALELATGHSVRLTDNTWPDRHPIWSPQGDAVAFASGRPEAPGIYRKAITGEEPTEVLPTADVNPLPWPTDWTARGIIYDAPKTGVSLLPPGRGQQPRPLVREQPGERDAKFSSDGKWLAFSAPESGRSELFVQSASTGEKWKVSPAGGSMPRWRRDGKMLFYVAWNGELVAVPIDETLSSPFRAPQPLFQSGLNNMPRPLRTFNVSRDGERFLMATSRPSTETSLLVVVSNWIAGLKSTVGH